MVQPNPTTEDIYIQSTDVVQRITLLKTWARVNSRFQYLILIRECISFIAMFRMEQKLEQVIL